MQKLLAGELESTLALDALEAADAFASQEVTQLLEKVDEKYTSNPLGKYVIALTGGDPRKGHDIFYEHAEAQCVRCHTVFEFGGTAGPSLHNVANRLTKEQILESLINPSARLAPGFGIVALTLNDGNTISGFLEKETDQELIIKSSEGTLSTVSRSDINTRQDIPSSMPPVGPILSLREIRDLVSFLDGLREN